MFTEKVGRLLLDLHFTRTFKNSSKSGDFAERVLGGCLVGSTLVKTKKGMTPIADINENDEVWSYNEKTKTNIWSTVVQKVNLATQKLYQIVVKNDTIKATSEHPFYTKKGWMNANLITKGMMVLLANGTWNTIQANIPKDAIVPVYNIEVVPAHTFYIGNEQVLVHNGFDCFKTKFKNLANASDEFFEDFRGNFSMLEKFDKGELSYDKWRLLKTSHKELAKTEAALLAFTKTSKNAKLKELGFTDELLAKVNGYRDSSFAQLMEDLDILGKHLTTNNIKIDNFTSVIDILKGGNPNYRQGVHWIIEDLGKELAFKGKNLQLELRVDNARETFSFIDLACKNCASNGSDILIEYKSGAGSITKETIQKQFIERDLFIVSSLEEIQWRLKNTTLTKDKLIGWLKENKETLNKLLNNNDKKIKIKKWFNLSDFETTITDNKIEDFVNLNYNAIFKQ